MRIRAVFFDLGDTLISSRVFEPNGELRAIEKAIELYNLKGRPSKYLPLAKEADASANKLIEGRRPGESLQEFGERIIRAKYGKLIELMGGVPDPEGVNLVFGAHIEGIATARSLFPEVEEVLSALRGRYKLGLLSNNIVEYARGPLEHLGLGRCSPLSKKVYRDATISLWGCRYKVPPEYIGQYVWLRIFAGLVNF